jgi:DNA repair exonuclease SbcCD ATPase subunit
MSDEKVFITSVYVQDFLGIEQFKAELGQVAVISGRNGIGKTSLMQAIHTVFEGGHDASMVRRGSEKAKVILTLSSGVTINKTITPKESTLEVLSPDGGVVKAPATYVKSLAPTLEGTGSFDPLGFLNSDPKERAAFLLKAIPIDFSPAEVSEILGVPLSGVVGLTRFNELREGKYSERTTLNTQVRDLEGTIADMERQLPADDATDWGFERDHLTESIAAIDGRINTTAAEIALEAEQRRSEKREEIASKITALEKELADYLAKVDGAASEALAEQTREMEAEKAVLSGKLGEARAKADHQQQSIGVKKAITERKEKLKGHITLEMKLTSIIRLMDALKHRKLKELPIPGLDIAMDSRQRPVIKIDGIPLDKLNRQKQLFVAIQAVSKAAGQLPLILAECAELDDDSLSELTEAAKDAGLQLIVARWKNEAPLEVVAA